ncbi:hypothetical protein [Helicobacter cinaedi]|uniref:hypothetical protein n=1 Tax=Helicobacter cinaedi TaxID=213 RepID=UPI0011C05625|nr:hypothetical protein [Helicobacter cinaedi]
MRVVLNGVKTVYNGISSVISVGTDLMGGIGKVGKMGKGFGGGRAPSNGGGSMRNHTNSNEVILDQYGVPMNLQKAGY